MGFQLAFDAANKILLLSARGVVTDQLILDGYELVKRCWEKLGSSGCVADYTDATENLLTSESLESLVERQPVVPPVTA